MAEITVIMPPEETNWRIEPVAVAKALASQWPQAQITWEDPSDRSDAFVFEWDTKKYHVVGSFGRNGRSLFLTRTTMEDLAEIAVWFRKLVPPSEPLGVWSDAGGYCELTPEMTATDFLGAYHY
jgi:hypothetical protein